MSCNKISEECMSCETINIESVKNKYVLTSAHISHKKSGQVKCLNKKLYRLLIKYFFSF